MGSQPQTHVNPERLMQITWSFAQPLAIDSAIQNRVFDVLDSGPKSVADLPSGRHESPATQLCQCILAMRLRDAAFADRLVALANVPAQKLAVAARGDLRGWPVALRGGIGTHSAGGTGGAERGTFNRRRTVTLPSHREVPLSTTNGAGCARRSTAELTMRCGN